MISRSGREVPLEGRRKTIMFKIDSIRLLNPGNYLSNLVFLLAITFSLAGCLAEVQEPEAPRSQHWDCKVCHLRDEPDPAELFDPSIDPSTLCIYCHPYQRNHHPTGVVPSPNILVDCSNSALPLFGRLEVRCLTCHEVHRGEKGTGVPGLIRGGPYKDKRELCFRCHIEESYSEIYIHDMLDNGTYRLYNGRIVCLYCHHDMPNAAVDRTDDVNFQADVAFLCWRCHPPMPGLFFERHFMKAPPAHILRQMRAMEAARNVNLPLVPRDRITCSTCHNPHEPGVLQTARAAAGSETPGRLRIPSREICTGCHPVK